MKKRTLGTVYIHGDYVHNNPDIIAEVFAKLRALPVRVDYHIDTHAFEYMLHSPLFREVELGSMAPEYEIVITCQMEDSQLAAVIDFDVEVRERLVYNPSVQRSTTLDFLVQAITGRK